MLFRASAALIANSTARRFSTGSAPGRPRQTGQTFVFVGAPNAVEQAQKIFVAVSSWAWISRPMIDQPSLRPSSIGPAFTHPTSHISHRRRCRWRPQAFGPAAFTDGDALPSNVLKFSTNIAASFFAWAS